MKREFKDMMRLEHYEYLNSEITGDYDKAHAVKCVNGTFVGTEEHGVASWLGIPYAKPPVGERRFKAPEYVEASDKVFEAKYYGKGAYGSTGYPDCVQQVMSEDCLYLNIWANADDKTEKKPVMVWIHGGAYVVGSGSQVSYSGCNLVQRQSDIIMVNINYRLNMYGFMDFSSVPGGESFGTAPCNGLLDQAMALRWVHENIAAFGGDPDNVTIFGQSAGGGSVSILPVMKEANQYFQKVIAQSGSTGLAFPVDCEAAQAKTRALLECTGCKTMDDIMALSEADLQKAYGFTVDGYNAWAAGRKEQKLAQLSDEEKGLVESFCRDIKGESYENTSRLFDQIVFIAPLFRLSENQTKAGGKSYTYFFTPESSIPVMRCGHAVELATVLNHPENTGYTGRAFDETFSKTMRRMWVQFAKTGDPSLSADISPDGKAKEWPLYDLENKGLMVFDEFNIHSEKESERGILDWDRTYFLTKYYCI